MPPPERTWDTPAEAALKHQVDERTIRRWASTGVIPAERTPSGRWRIVRLTPLDPTTTEGQP